MFGNVRGGCVRSSGDLKKAKAALFSNRKNLFSCMQQKYLWNFIKTFFIFSHGEALQSGTKICLELGILAVLSTTKFFMQNFLLMIQFPLWLGIAFLSAISCNLCHGLLKGEENSHVKHLHVHDTTILWCLSKPVQHAMMNDEHKQRAGIPFHMIKFQASIYNEQTTAFPAFAIFQINHGKILCSNWFIGR